jgi:hypothetical protein
MALDVVQWSVTMSVTGLGTRRQAVRLPVLSVLSGLMLIAALVLFALELINFEQSRERLQTDITVAGVPVSGLRLAEAVTAWENIYQQPVLLEYLGHPIQLSPASIGFVIKSDQMQSEIRAQTALSSNYGKTFGITYGAVPLSRSACRSLPIIPRRACAKCCRISRAVTIKLPAAAILI